ncbi:MAG: RNA methyltransferase [Ardenticatenaceae bacterium]|nr:RNA methyltransferase [Ardenticatenaceae bacterium]
MFQMYQCPQPDCRFRFPAEIGDARAAICPRCHTPTQIVHASFHNAETPLATSPAPPIHALLDNIRSIHNVGSMFRTADGAGLAHLYLCGITATPTHPKLAKAALGAHETIPWSYHPNGWETAVSLKNQGYQLWALEADPRATPLLTPAITLPAAPILLIVGNEKAGVDPAILDECDHIYTLPMHGHKNSLNAAVAFGIAVYHLLYVNLTKEEANA